MKTAPRIVRLLFGCFGMLAGVGCTSTSSANRALPVTAPFAMDKAGNTARIDFSVVEGQANLKRRFMVSLDFPQTENYSIEKIIQQKKVPVHVEVFEVDHGEMKPIPTQDDEAIVAAANGSEGRADTQLATLDLYATDGKTSSVLIAGFYASRYGHYIAVVKTVRDFSMFKNVAIELKVDEFYNTGK